MAAVKGRVRSVCAAEIAREDFFFFRYETHTERAERRSFSSPNYAEHYICPTNCSANRTHFQARNSQKQLFVNVISACN